MTFSPSFRIKLLSYPPPSAAEIPNMRINRAPALLDEIRNDKNVGRMELKSLEASCFELAGGYHISCREYDATVFINEAIRQRNLGSSETSTYTAPKVCYMHLQTEDPVRLFQRQELIHLSRPENHRHYMATGARFVGVSMFLSGKYD